MDTIHEMIDYLNKKLIKEFDHKFFLEDKGIVFKCQDGPGIYVRVIDDDDDDDEDEYIIEYGNEFTKYSNIDDIVFQLCEIGLTVRENKKEFSRFCTEYEQFCQMMMYLFDNNYTTCLWGINYQVNNNKTIYVGIEPEDFPLMTIREFTTHDSIKELTFEKKYNTFVDTIVALREYGLKGRENGVHFNLPENIPFYCKMD